MMTDKTCGTCRHALRPVVYCGRAKELAYEDGGNGYDGGYGLYHVAIAA